MTFQERKQASHYLEDLRGVLSLTVSPTLPLSTPKKHHTAQRKELLMITHISRMHRERSARVFARMLQGL